MFFSVFNNILCFQSATELPDLYGIRRSGRQRKEVTRYTVAPVSYSVYCGLTVFLIDTV